MSDINPRRRKKPPRFDHGPPISRIDTRPMVFVSLFIALIFLLKASEPHTHALVINLPDHSGPPSETALIARQYRISVSSDDEITIDDPPAAFAELPIRLAAIQENTDPFTVTFEPDGMASYDTFVKVLREIHLAGLNDWNFRIDGTEQHREIKTDRSSAAFPNRFRSP